MDLVVKGGAVALKSSDVFISGRPLYIVVGPSNCYLRGQQPKEEGEGTFFLLSGCCCLFYVLWC